MGLHLLRSLRLTLGLSLGCQNQVADQVPPEDRPDAAVPAEESSMFSTGVCLSGWCWEQPLPFGPQLPWPTGFWAASRDEGWAIVGEALVHWKDGRWNNEEGEFRAPVRGTDANNVIVAAAEGAMHFDGVAWSPMVDCPQPDALWIAAPDSAWLASVHGHASDLSSVTLYHWNGVSCTLVESFEHAEWAVLDGTDPDDGWLALRIRTKPPPSEVRGQLLHWNGTTWTIVREGGNISEFAAVTPDLAWLVEEYWLWKWDGVQWSKTTTQFVSQIWFASPTDGWASTGYGAAPERSGSILRWSGADWSTVRSERDYPVYLFGADREDLLETLAGGRGARWNGDTWMPTLPSRDPFDLNDITVGTSGQVWAVSEKALLQRSGDVWSLVDEEGGTIVWSGLEREAWVGGASGLRRWADGWHSESLPRGVNESIVAIWGTSPRDVFVATASSLNKWSPSGWEWSRPAPSEIGLLTAVHGSGPDDVWVLGSSGLARLTGGGWEIVSLPHCPGGNSGVVIAELDDLWVESPGRPLVVGHGAYTDADVVRGTMTLWRQVEAEGWMCDTIGGGSQTISIAACDGEVWITSSSEVGRVIARRWEPSAIAGVPTAITCGVGIGFWTSGRGGQVAHRPSPLSQ